MARRTYHALKDGEWIRPAMRGFRDACCDCGLVHKVDFRIVDGRVELRAYRDARATAGVRRPFRFGDDDAPT